jgi:coenzyme PQQ synthesis protein D (PqqD)
MTLDDRLVIPPTVISRDLDGETVILNLDSGIYFGLDTVGTVIWKHLQDAAQLREVRDRMLADYDVSPDVAAQDLLRLAEQFVSRGLALLESPKAS